MSNKVTQWLLVVMTLLALLGGVAAAVGSQYETKEAATLKYEHLKQGIAQNSHKLDRIIDRLEK